MQEFDKTFRDPLSGDGKKNVVEEIGDVVAFARERLGFNPDEKQELVLRGGHRGIVNCTRQLGNRL